MLIDLKLTQQDLGQMQMYANNFERHQREENEAPAGGVLVCSDNNDATLRIRLPEDKQQFHASRWQLYPPTEEELREELERDLCLSGKELNDGED